MQSRCSTWKQEPYLSNVEVMAVKSAHVPLAQQLTVADELLWESTVASKEKPMWDVWRKQLRAMFGAEVQERHDANTAVPSAALVGG